MNIQSISVKSLIALDKPQKKIFDSRINEIKNILKEPNEFKNNRHLNNKHKQKHIPFIVPEKTSSGYFGVTEVLVSVVIHQLQMKL